jgi:23S rRNA (adenine-N6)-dimethyltransferase
VRASAARRWGWHRLDRSWAERIVSAAGIVPGDLVLDIGAGDGVISAALLGVGARVVAIELHPDRARLLRARFADQIRVLAVDASDLRLPRQPFKVVANPPFTIAMALLRRLLAPGSRLIAADIVLPRHIARRWCRGAVDGAGRWGNQFDVSLGTRVPCPAFRPPIDRDAVVLCIRRLEAAGGRWRPSDVGRGQRGPPAR